MKGLRIIRKNSLGQANPWSSEHCQRCHGYMAEEWSSELERNIKRCILCGNRKETVSGKEKETLILFK